MRARTDNFIKGSLFTLIARVIVLFLSLLISIYIARILGPEAKGMYYLLAQLVFIVVSFAMFGINNSAVYFQGKQRMPQPELYGDLFILTALSGLMFFILMMLSRNFLLASILKGIPAQYVFIMIIATFFLMLHQISLSIILGQNKIRNYNIFEVITYVFLCLNFFIFAVILKKGIYGAYLGFAMTYLLMDCLFVFLFIGNIALKIKWARVKEILHYGLRSFLGPICLLVIFKLDSFILNVYRNIRDVGFYSIAVSFAELILFVPLAIGIVLFPKLTSQETDKLNSSAARVIRTMFLFLVFLCLFFLIFGKWLIISVYGRVYIPSILPMYILLPGFVFVSLYYLFFSYFNAMGKPEIFTYITIITLAIKFVLSIIAIPKWGILGAAGASTASYLFFGIIFLGIFLRKSGKTWGDTLIIKNSDIKYIWNIFAANWRMN